MLKPRIIPCLLIDEYGDMVKTIKFDYSNRRYIGDVENAVKIFNEKKIDELIVLDISATLNKREPNYNLIKKIASSCRMPFSYGGGIKNIDQVKNIIKLGVEKIILNTVTFENKNLIKEVAQLFGSQSIAVCFDVTFKDNQIHFFSNSGTKCENNIEDPLNFIKEIQSYNPGELIINSIDRDGTMTGYELNCIKKIFPITKVPLTILGGAGKIEHLKDVINTIPLSGLSSGSLFIYKSRLKAILINYPNKSEIFNS